MASFANTMTATLLETQSTAFPVLFGSRRIRFLTLVISTALLWVIAQSMYSYSSPTFDSLRYTRTVVNLNQHQHHPHTPSHACSDPYYQFGSLHVDLTRREENNWVPFNKQCQPPRLMASLAHMVGSDIDSDWSPSTSPSTLTDEYEDVNFARNRTILVMGDSIARETVKYFCNFLGQDVVNLSDEHPWSPFAEPEPDLNGGHNKHRKRAPRESSLPNVCYIPSIDLMIIQSFHFGMDTESFFAMKEQYNPPNNYEDRLRVHGRNILNLISNTEKTDAPLSFQDAVPRPSSEPDLVEVSSSLWDLARFARIDIEDDVSTLTDLTHDRLAFYTDRMSDMLESTLSEFPQSQVVWRTSHYPSDCNDHKLDWIGRNMVRLEQERLYQDKPYFHSNRLFQLDQAARYVLEKEEFKGVRLNEWGRLM